ncbi:hypothetical protein HZA40_03965 [Candidatus Peregrinibacteria bacterium]|nr:hypothetical protein [Candidatus Peregrinibacteria bacterium]
MNKKIVVVISVIAALVLAIGVTYALNPGFLKGDVLGKKGAVEAVGKKPVISPRDKKGTSGTSMKAKTPFDGSGSVGKKDSKGSASNKAIILDKAQKDLTGKEGAPAKKVTAPVKKAPQDYDYTNLPTI